MTFSVIIYDHLRYAAQTLASPRKKSGSLQDVLLYIQKLLPFGKWGATHVFFLSIEKRKSGILGGISSSLNRSKSERQGNAALVKKGLVVIIPSGWVWQRLAIRR
jgi:hypothetical protein